MLRRAFTLLEVNLAMLIMAGGVLSIVTLYSLGFRENTQSTEDVASAALADAVLGRAAMALSDTNVTWAAFNAIKTLPENGWAGYFERTGEVISDPTGLAEGVYAELLDKVSASGVSSQFPEMPRFLKGAGFACYHDENSPVVHLAFRASGRAKALMSSPIYYTAVTFQGIQEPPSSNNGTGN